MLSQEQVSTYEDDGFVIADFRMPQDVLEDIKQRHARLIENLPEFTDYCPALLGHDPGFKEYADVPEIQDMIEQLIGPDFALWNMSFFAKPALNGSTTPWHQDGEYWPIRPLATCTVWLAVDPATTENGCLKMMAGSHKDHRLYEHSTNSADGLALDQEIHAAHYDESRAVNLELEAGQMSLHDVFLVHGSDANQSPNPRRGMTMRFMPTTSLFDRDVARQMNENRGITDHSERPVYLMRGGDRHGSNQFVNV